MQTNPTIHNLWHINTLDGLKKCNENVNLHLHLLLGVTISWQSDPGQVQVSNLRLRSVDNKARKKNLTKMSAQ